LSNIFWTKCLWVFWRSTGIEEDKNKGKEKDANRFLDGGFGKLERLFLFKRLEEYQRSWEESGK